MTPELQAKADHTADYHTRMANHWASKAALAAHSGNEDDVEKCNRQRQSHLDAADTIRALLRLVNKRSTPASRTFTPPTLIEVIAFAKEHDDVKGAWPVADIKAWWNHFQSNGWKVSGKTPMKDWKAAALNGFKNWRERNPGKAAGPPVAHSDPDGWVAYLKSVKLPWVAYKYAADHVKSEFVKQQTTAK